MLLARHEDGVPWYEQAVLARTHDQLLEIAATLGRAGIPFRMASMPRAGRATNPLRPTASSEDRGAVELATFHRAKGLEWTAVCVAGLEDGYVPIVHAASDESRAEERRLLYVALTRASRELHCSWARDPGDAGRVARSSGGRRPGWPRSSAGGETGHGAGSGPTEGTRRVAALRAGLGTTPTAQSTSTSMKTGAWSDGFSPLRALRSISP